MLSLSAATAARDYLTEQLKDCGKSKPAQRRAATYRRRIAQFETIIAIHHSTES
jgi:hypothetical protein